MSEETKNTISGESPFPIHIGIKMAPDNQEELELAWADGNTPLDWNGSAIFRVNADLGSDDTNGRIIFVYDFRSGDLLGIERTICNPDAWSETNPVHCTEILLDAEDVAGARAKLDRLYPCAGPGENADRDVVDPIQPCGAWDFSIKPSVGDDLDPANRISPSESVTKAWQKAPGIATEDQIAASDPPLEAARKATRQFKRALQPFELSWILKANGIDLSTGAASEISEQLVN